MSNQLFPLRPISLNRETKSVLHVRCEKNNKLQLLFGLPHPVNYPISIYCKFPGQYKNRQKAIPPVVQLLQA